MAEPQAMAELWRGGRLESVHAGHAVICDGSGAVVDVWGDAGAVIYPRSSCKMVQALPLIESGAADAAGLNDRQLALACASHQGAAMHTGMVESWLGHGCREVLVDEVSGGRRVEATGPLGWRAS